MEYLFQLGQNRPLSTAELKAIFPSAQATSLSHFDRYSFPSNFDPLPHASKLGGVIKISRLIPTTSSIDLASRLAQVIKDNHHKNFSLTTIDSPLSDTINLAHRVKDMLTTQGVSSRFIQAPPQSLSPLIISKQHVTEIIIDPEDSQIYHTVWLHPYDLWIERDRKKPYIDAHSGMLPPKLARIMVNLALGDQDPSSLTLLDPFSGTGTILMEARLLGLNLIGADHSETAVKGTLANIKWLPSSHYIHPPGRLTVVQADATHLAKVINETIDIIVTEPYLGPANFASSRIPNIVKGLQKLYLGALKNWLPLLKSKAKLVIAFPQFITPNRTISTLDFLDSHPNLGYNLLVKDLVFTRPSAKIIRQIAILEKN